MGNPIKMNTYSVNMSVEQSLMLRVPKTTAATKEEAEEFAQSAFAESELQVTNEKLTAMKNSLEHDDTVVQVGNIEDSGDHFKVAVSFLESFYFNMKGNDESKLDDRAIGIMEKSSAVSHADNLDFDVLMTRHEYLTSSMLPEDDLEFSMA